MDTLLQEPTFQNADPAVKYDEAISNRDPVALLNVAKETYGHPLSTVALNAAENISKTKQEFNSLVDPIEKAGGAATPQGRLETVNQFKTIKDNPQWGDALIMYLMGDKESAAKMVTGGPIKTQYVYDSAGRQIRERVNALGETVESYDEDAKKALTPQERAARKVGLTSWQQSLGYQQEQANLKTNVESLNKNVAANNYWAAKTEANLPKAKEMLRLNQQIKELPPELASKVYEASSRAMQKASSVSNNRSLLGQIQKGAGFKDGEEVGGQFANALQLGEGPIVWNAGKKSFENRSTGKTKSISELEQEQNTNNISNDLQNNATQTQANLALYFKTHGIKQEDQYKVIRYFDLANEIGRDYAEAAAKHDVPAFLTLPSAARVEDPNKKGAIQALSIIANGDTFSNFQNYFNNNIKNYGPGTAPRPNEIENAFTNTSEFKTIQDNYGRIVQRLMDEPAQVMREAEKPKVAVPPKREVVKPTEKSFDLNSLIPIKRKQQ